MTHRDAEQLDRIVGQMTDAEKREFIDRLTETLRMPGRSLPSHDPANGVEPKTPLGKRLRDLRQRILESGEPLLDWDALEREVETRRGERTA